MKRLLVVLVLVLSTSVAFAKEVTFDLVRFEPPAAYKKTAWEPAVVEGTYHSYTVTDQKAGTYCRIAVYKSIASKGDVDAEFLSEWAELTKIHGVMTPGQVTDPLDKDGWKVKAGVATFEFSGGTSILMMTTFTGNGRTASLVMLTNSEDYFPAIEKFLASVRLIDPAGVTVKTKTTTKTKPPATAPATKGAKQQHAEQYMEYNTMLKTWVWKWRYPKAQ